MKHRKKHLTANPFICMTDLMVSLNAGLLVLGVISTVDPNEWKQWLQLQQETVQVENDLAEARSQSRDLLYRYQSIQSAQPGRGPEGVPAHPAPTSGVTLADKTDGPLSQ